MRKRCTTARWAKRQPRIAPVARTPFWRVVVIVDGGRFTFVPPYSVTQHPADAAGSAYYARCAAVRAAGSGVSEVVVLTECSEDGTDWDQDKRQVFTKANGAAVVAAVC